MSDALFLAELGGASIGDLVELTGDEGRHAVVVKRIQVGESLLVADGHGRAVRGLVVEVQRDRLTLKVAEIVADSTVEQGDTGIRFHAVQALAKGDRSELAVELLTEVGCTEITAWQSARSIVRWDAAKATKGLARWQATAREATKQSRRFTIPTVGQTALCTKQLCAELRTRTEAGELVLLLHEDAQNPISSVSLDGVGAVTVIVGPEGGIGPEEVAMLTEAGAHMVSISDGVLRASTAAAVAVVQLRLMREMSSDD